MAKRTKSRAAASGLHKGVASSSDQSCLEKDKATSVKAEPISIEDKIKEAQQLLAKLQALQEATSIGAEPVVAPDPADAEVPADAYAYGEDPAGDLENMIEAPRRVDKKAEVARVDQVLRRLCQRKKRGMMVPEEIHKLWVKGGSQRRELAKILIEVGEDKDAFCQKVTHRFIQSRSNTFKVGEELECTRDKYEKKVYWFYVDVAFEGISTKENKEEIDRTTDLGNASVAAVPLGLEAGVTPGGPAGGMPPPEEEMEEVSSESEEGDEDMDSIPEVLSEILKQQGKSQSADLLKKQIDELTDKHDKIADMKASYDCDEAVDGSSLSKLMNEVSKLTVLKKKSNKSSPKAKAKPSPKSKSKPKYAFDYFDKIYRFCKIVWRCWAYRGGKRLSSLALFWGRFQLLRPNHPVFELSESDRAYTVPIYLFADEGRGYKKTGIMILGYEPVLGFGCEAEDEKTSRDELKMNFVGNTYMTRMLFSVLPKTSYEKKDIRLHALVENLTMDLARCFESGLSVKVEGRDVLLRVVAIGLKGDWPALIKLGKLERHFTRESYPYGKGLCHLCQANTEMCHSWHECDFTTAPWVATMSTAPMPWRESNLNLHLNQLTRKIISWGSHADYPSWFKGADTVVINKFLQAKFTALLGSHDFGDNVGYIQQVDQCLRDANDFMTSLYRAGLFITLKRLKHVVRVGQSMVKGYSQCANLAFRSNLARFKFNPKYHMLCHIIYSLTQELAARRCPINPLAYSCQMPETHSRCADNQRELAQLREAAVQAAADREEMERLREENRASKQRAAALEAERARYEETLARQKDAMKEMQTKLQEMMQHSKDSGAEAVVQKLMKKAGISDEVVISTEQVWVRLYRDAVTRRERQEKLRAEKQAQQQQDRETREDQVRRRESEIFAIPPIEAASPTRKEVSPSQPSPSQPSPQGSPMCAWLRADLDLSPVRVMQAPQRRRILAPPKGQLQTSHSAPSFLPAAAAVSLSQCR
ncbi:unnamed protein product [Symbiodinium microadriaticum]|nr:unnamed protein product [Symbiodinium microadriaticum]